MFTDQLSVLQRVCFFEGKNSEITHFPKQPKCTAIGIFGDAKSKYCILDKFTLRYVDSV